MFLWFDVKMAVARTVLASMEERVTRPVTSSANVSRVNAVRMQQGTSAGETGTAIDLSFLLFWFFVNLSASATLKSDHSLNLWSGND